MIASSELPRRLTLRPPNRSEMVLVGAWVAALVALKLVFVALESGGSIVLSTPLPTILLGVIIGLTYGLLAVGLVLVFRISGIINFAHGQIGAFGAAIFGLFVSRWNAPYWLLFPFVIVLGALVGAGAEAGVVRRLRNAPRLMSVVATLGVGQFLLFLGLAINPEAVSGFNFPQPAGIPGFGFGPLKITPAYTAMLLLSPVVVIALSIFLKQSKVGLAMRAAAANGEAARMAGISSARMSSLAWALAGALSAFSAVLAAPGSSTGGAGGLGPGLLLRALAAAVLARMNSLPKALGAGVVLGVGEQLLLWNYPRGGLVELALFVTILGVLLAQKQIGGRAEAKGSWAAVQALRPIPDSLRAIWLVRHLDKVGYAILLGLLVLLPFSLTSSQSVTVTGMLAFAIVGLSVGMLTGLAGQLTLGQFAVGAMGLVVSYYVSSRTADFGLGILYGAVGAGCVSVALGLPALRIRGLMLSVTTLAFAIVVPSFLLELLLGETTNPGRPILPGGVPLDTGKEYYWFALALFAVALRLAANLRRSGFGRLLVAVRDNEDGARAFTVRASVVKVQGYFLAGFLAGIGGAVYGHALSDVGATTFGANASIDIAVMTVIGGVSLLVGPILGVLLVLGVPAFVPLDSAGLAASQLGLLIIILYVPGGLAQLVGLARDRLIRVIAARRGIDYDAAHTNAEDTPAAPAPAAAALTGPTAAGIVTATPVRSRHTRRPLLEARGLEKSFGGIHAVRGVSLSVAEGETLGLIGPNGAGKTTTFELLGGFTRADAGEVRFARRDVTMLGPEARGRLGLIRSFQDAALFPTMTVTECVMLALERTRPTMLSRSILGLRAEERRKHSMARELIASMGLDAYRDKQILELSTGTRRICEIACLVALQPRMLLLDEPSSGIAQRESEALGELLMDLRARLGLTLIVIEHDMPLIMSISDRIVAMADGRVISVGTPDEVKADPVVVESYLGGDVSAIERSGPALAHEQKGAIA